MYYFNLWCMKLLSGVLLCLFFIGWEAQAQTSRDAGTSQQQGSRYNSKQKIKKVKKKKKGKHDVLIEEYHDRMKANAKAHKKAAKEMEKPQYSDPSYFGHKRPPKKRPVGKRKFCKECGIVH